MAGTIYGQQIRNMKTLPKASAYHLDAVNGDYYKDLDNELDKFVGNWLFQSNNQRVELSITKITRDLFNNSRKTVYIDKLSVEFKYYENGILIKETAPGFHTDLSQIEMMDLVENQIIGPNNLHDDGYSKIAGTYYEPFNSSCMKPEPGTLWLSYKSQNNSVNGIPTVGKLTWVMRTYRGLSNISTVLGCADNYVLPPNMVFIKQP